MNEGRERKGRVIALTSMALAAGAGIAMHGPILKRRIEDLRFKETDEQALKAAEEKRARKAAKLQRSGL